MPGARRELLQRQAESIGLPLHEVLIPPQCVNPIYEARMEEALRLFYGQGIRKVAFGDIFLEDLRVYREKNLARIGMTALFPIWKRNTRELLRHFHEQHFRSIAASGWLRPHPWNYPLLAPKGLFPGAVLKDRRLAFLFPLVVLFAGDIFIGLHKLIAIVYASFLVNVAIGLWLRDCRTIARISLATVLGAIQFFIVTNFAAWQFLGGFPHIASGLRACYIAGVPFFWNTLAGDALYAALLFVSFALAQRFVPALNAPGQRASS